MYEKDKQLYETTLVVESAKQTVELGKDVVSDIVRPTSKSIGQTIGYIVDGSFGWLGVWGQKQKIKQKKYIEDYKNEINKNIEAIPQENLKEPTMSVVGPAIASSIFYYENDYYKKMFSKLIAASCDKTKSVHPAYTTIIKEIDPLDAQLLMKISNKALPYVKIFSESTLNGKIQPLYPNIIIYDTNLRIDEYFNLSKSIDNLDRLKLISIRNDIICFENEYQTLNDCSIYQLHLKILEPNERISIRKYRVELTELGRSFVQLVL